MNFVTKTPYANQYDKRHESDQQMLSRIGRKFAILFLVFIMFDSLLDWFLGLIDIVIHLLHLIIEAIEYSLELFLGQILQTNPHQSETIIVNGAVVIALYLAYRLMIVVPRWYVRFKRNFRAAYLRRIRRESSCWRAMPLSHKIKWVSAYGFGTACLLFVMT